MWIVVVCVFFVVSALGKPSLDMAVNHREVVTTALPSRNTLARIEAAARGAELKVAGNDTTGHLLLLDRGVNGSGWANSLSWPGSGGRKNMVPELGFIARYCRWKVMETMFRALPAAALAAGCGRELVWLSEF